MKIIAKKVKMTQIWQDDKVIPVTVLELKENPKDKIGDIEVGDKVMIKVISKGKGFQGVVKRHGFAGGPKSHGQKHKLRAPGSIGATAPQRTIPGRKMPWRAGGKKVTVKNLRVVEYDAEKRIIFLKGAVPGMKGSEVGIYK